ncbi:hypothetical protein [Stenotrophomonas nematodicola]|uniref:DUF551 domain-containing protein n=1 Tax=Stenotrophomonas nematodicola TaxID=2656746 RepID=A0ABW7D202_9GAMM
MSNEPHASTSPDIDALALDVARRFTEEWDPQRHATLQAALVQAVRAAHAQPADLAEQQRASPIDVTHPWRRLYQSTLLPAPTEYGDITHPDIPSWPDDREDALDKLVAAVAYAQLAAMELDAGTRGHTGWLSPPSIWPWEPH